MVCSNSSAWGLNYSTSQEKDNDMVEAVWSWWTLPVKQIGSDWLSEFHELLGWVLSVETARRSYPSTVLVTDDAGARTLVDGLRLPFDTVSTALNDLNARDPDPDWRVLGKLYAYRWQERPFVHIDNDVFLWSRLPDRLETASVFAQNPEYITFGSSYYQPERIEHTIRSVGGWMPKEIEYYISGDGTFTAACCGIMGGTDLEFLRYYADSGIRMMEHPGNRAAWESLRGVPLGLIYEQYLLAACIKYHKGRPGSPFSGIRDEYLFESPMDSHHRASEVGFTHLLGPAKRNENVAERVRAKVEREYPDYYDRCAALVGR
jgi:hypothetical protein